MEEILLVLNMAILLLLGGFCSIVFKRFNMPAVIGYLVSGIIIAAIGWNTLEVDEIVDFLSDIGLALMMFCIGMELNLTKLRKMGSFAILVVLIQVPIILVGGIVLGEMILGLSSLQGLVFGAIISGSSTAVVTIVLAEQKSLSHSEVESLILVTVVEDVVQVLILSAISPLMVGESMDIDGIIWMLAMIITFMVVAVIVGIAVIPKFLDWLHKKMPAEILLVIALGICFGLAYLSLLIGMSMAIGAFLAGVIVSQSSSTTTIEEHITPMKDVFMMMFFISIGMEISVGGLVNNILTIVVIYLIYFGLKFGSVILAYFIGNKPMSLAYSSSIALVAMGEFAFIISKEALEGGIITNDFYTAIIGAALVSMIVLPIINKHNDRVVEVIATKSPAVLQRAYHNLDVRRGMLYSRLSTISKNTQKGFRTKLTNIYLILIIIVILQVVFVLATPEISNFVYDHTPQEFNRLLSTALVMLMNFIALMPLLYVVVNYLKYVMKVFLDADRRSIAAGGNGMNPTLRRGMRYYIRRNSIFIAILFDALILLLTPNNIEFIGRILVLVAGVVLVLFAMAYSYVRRS